MPSGPIPVVVFTEMEPLLTRPLPTLVMDLTENFEYQGTLALSVEQLDGKQPDLYVNDLVNGQKVHSGREAVSLELMSRYRKPSNGFR